MADAAPQGAHLSIDTAGHNVIIDAPRWLASTISDFVHE